MECAPILENPVSEQLAYEFQEIGEVWDNIADLMWELSISGEAALLKTMSIMIDDIWKRETNVFRRLLHEISNLEI